MSHLPDDEPFDVMEVEITAILPPDMMETQPHERSIHPSVTTSDTSQHIRQQNADNKRVGDLGQSSGVKRRKPRSEVWENFDRRQDKNGLLRATCKGCGKDFDGSSKLGTTHLRNHFKSCQRKRNGGGGGDNLAGNLSDTIVITEKSVMDQPLNHLEEARMIIKQGDAFLIDSTNKGYIIELYEEEKGKLRNYFKKLSCRLCLTVCKTESVIDDDLVDCFCSKVWFVDDDWKLKNKIIGLKGFSDDKTVMEDIKEMLLEWGIENNLSSMVIDVGVDNNLYERGDWFSNQGSLLLNNKLTFKRGSFLDYFHGYHDIGETGNTYFPRLCSFVKRLRELSNSSCILNGLMDKAKDEWRQYNLVLAVAAVLDPRFRMNIVKKWYEEILGGIWEGVFGDEWEAEFKNFEDHFTKIYHRYARDINNFKSCTSGSEETNSSISYKMLSPLGEPYEPNDVQLQKSELQLYLEDIKFPLLQDFDALKWWGDHSQHFPTLARMARDFLSLDISCDYVSIDSFYDMDVSEGPAIAEAYTCTQSWLAT